jgi:hypothetical protein
LRVVSDINTEAGSMTTFDILLIGAGSTLVRSGEILLEKEHRIRGVVSSDPDVRSWATKLGVHCYDATDRQLATTVPSFDVLLSIGNFALVDGAW